MRAFAVPSLGEPASVHDLPVPTAYGEVLIRVRFAGVNPLDNNLLGRLTAASSYPFVVGIDFAGVAEHVPAEAHGLRAGDRVFGMARTHGSYAEYTAVAPAAAMEPLARIPDGVADDQAAALPIPAVTAPISSRPRRPAPWSSPARRSCRPPTCGSTPTRTPCRRSWSMPSCSRPTAPTRPPAATSTTTTRRS